MTTFSPELIALAHYLAGEFDNRTQALADPVWYVNLRLWMRPLPVSLFPNSITLFAEQANVLTLDQSYRPRFLQLYQSSQTQMLHVQYYMPKNIKAVQGAGRNLDQLKSLTPEQLEFLPGCILNVTCEPLSANTYCFKAFLPQNTPCCFTYQNQEFQVDLGFEAKPNEFFSYDKGIDPKTNKATWGALLGPFHFIKRQDFAQEIASQI